jgi:hypothetical protein
VSAECRNTDGVQFQRNAFSARRRADLIGERKQAGSGRLRRRQGRLKVQAHNEQTSGGRAPSRSALG